MKRYVLIMKQFVWCACTAIIIASCGQSPTVEKRTPEEKWEIIQDHLLATGATASDERPLPNVLSEREALLKTADLAIDQGVLDPTSWIYQDHPDLMYAKIETPILVMNAESGEPSGYDINAVDDNGVFLAGVSVRADVNIDPARFKAGLGFAIPGTSTHYITKREAVELIQSQFPDSVVSDPIAIHNLRLRDDPHSHRDLFWYFTVGNDGRSVAGAGGEEYVIAASIAGYRGIPGGVSNRALINRGPTYLNGYRMAKLDTPIHLFDKLNAARAVGGASFSSVTTPREPVGFTPTSLK